MHWRTHAQRCRLSRFRDAQLEIDAVAPSTPPVIGYSSDATTAAKVSHVAYTWNVTNTSPSNQDATSVVFNARNPSVGGNPVFDGPSLTLKQDGVLAQNCTTSASGITCLLAPISGAAVKELQLSANVSSGAAASGNFTIIGQVANAEGQAVGSGQTSSLATVADLAVTAAASTPDGLNPALLQPVTYIFTISNNTPA